jgi:hypothetical protein
MFSLRMISIRFVAVCVSFVYMRHLQVDLPHLVRPAILEACHMGEYIDAHGVTDKTKEDKNARFDLFSLNTKTSYFQHSTNTITIAAMWLCSVAVSTCVIIEDKVARENVHCDNTISNEWK